MALCFGIALTLSVDAPSAAHAQSATQLRLLQSDANRVIVELEVADDVARTQTLDGAPFTALSIAGLDVSHAPGQPQLPIKSALIGVPPGAELSFEMLADDARSASLPYPPLPAPSAQVQYDPNQQLPRYVGQRAAPDPSIYASDQLYPAEAARIASTGNWRSQRYARIEFAPLQVNPLTREVIFHQRLRVAVSFRYADATQAESLGRPLDEGAFEQVFAQTLLNYASAKSWRALTTTAQPSVPGSAAISAAPMYKLAINSDGIYQISCAQLASAGVDLAALDPSTLKIYKQGRELAIDVAGSNWGNCNPADHYLEFFAEAARTRYTDTNIYWLTFGGALGRRMAQRSGSGSGAPSQMFTRSVHIEQNRQYIPYLPMSEDSNHWYSFSLPNSYDPDGNGDPNSVDYTFAADQLALGAGSATLQTSLWGLSTGDHHTLTYLNDNLLEDATWSGRVEHAATLTFPQSYLNSGANMIRIVELLPAPNAIYVGHFDVRYASQYRATNDVLRFQQPSSSNWQYQLKNFSDAAIEVFDIADPFNVARIVGGTISQAPQYDVYLPLITRGGAASSIPGASQASARVTYSLQFADAISSGREYIALTAAQRKTPLSIALDSPSSLRSASNAADYLIIAYGRFISNVQPLAALRQSQGFAVKVVDVQDVYDEFSDGLMDAQAIRDFLQYAYGNWQAPKLQYVLLVGNGNFDFKNYYGTGEPTFIPPYLRLVDPWLGETASDNRLVAFEAGNPLPNLYIGRLPALSAADVDAMIAKIVGYEQNPPTGAWRSTVAFVSDNAFDASGNPDPAGNFWALSDSVASTLPNNFTLDRIYYNPCSACPLPYAPYPSDASVRSGLVVAINDGRLIVNYIGHSAIQYWAGEGLFRLADINALNNGGKLPIILAMTCYDGYFHFPGVPSMAATNVRLAGRGAVASWSASGLGVATGHDYLDRGFFNALMQQGLTRLGPAIAAAKANLYSTGNDLDLIDTFNLLGDPATRVALP